VINFMLLSYELHAFESNAQGIMRVAIEAWRWAGISHRHAWPSSVVRAPQVLHNHGDIVTQTMNAHKHSILGLKSHGLFSPAERSRLLWKKQVILPILLS
jgi:hypothetical protein